MKPAYRTATIAAGAAAAIIIAVAVFALGGNTAGPLTAPATKEEGTLAGETFSAGNFTATVVEDDAERFLAKVENKGPTLDHAAAFAVAKRVNENTCEPQGVVIANFQVSRQQGGNLVPSQDSLRGGATVDIDSKQANLNNIPVGDDVETAIYVMRLQPGSIRATDLVQRIDLQAGGQQQNATYLQAFESCLQKTGKGYPLLLHLENLPRASQTFYFTVTDGATGNKYETALKTSLQGDIPKELFWPPSRDGWLAGNFTKDNGPAPFWLEKPTALTIALKVVDSTGQVIIGGSQPEKAVSLDGLHESSLDFAEVAKGNAVPIYPKYWQIPVDLG